MRVRQQVVNRLAHCHGGRGGSEASRKGQAARHLRPASTHTHTQGLVARCEPSRSGARPASDLCALVGTASTGSVNEGAAAKTHRTRPCGRRRNHGDGSSGCGHRGKTGAAPAVKLRCLNVPRGCTRAAGEGGQASHCEASCSSHAWTVDGGVGWFERGRDLSADSGNDTPNRGFPRPVSDCDRTAEGKRNGPGIVERRRKEHALARPRQRATTVVTAS